MIIIIESFTLSLFVIPSNTHCWRWRYPVVDFTVAIDDGAQWAWLNDVREDHARWNDAQREKLFVAITVTSTEIGAQFH